MARLRAADLMLKDLTGAGFGDPSDIANSALASILSGATAKVEKVDPYPKILNKVRLWSHSRNSTERATGYTVREIMDFMEQDYEITREGSQNHIKRALEEIGWEWHVKNGRGKVWFLIN